MQHLKNFEVALSTTSEILNVGSPDQSSLPLSC